MIKKYDLSEIKTKLTEPFDLFLCSSSFEDRCLSVAMNVDANNIQKAIIFSNVNLIDYIGNNKKKLENYFKEVSSIDINTSDPILTADNIDGALKQAIDDNLVNSILIDITTFTHESLLILLRLLQLRCPNANITGIYASASQYSVDGDIAHKWLSTGIQDIRSVLGFPGKVTPSRRTHLILIVGYEQDRAIKIIEKIEPHSISLGYGKSDSATTKKHHEANEYYMNLVKEMAISFSYSDIALFEIPCDDPYGTLEKIREEIANHKEMNIILAPMNNKISTVGAAWACFENSDIQMCYSQTLQYNYSYYSTPGSKCYVFDLSNR